MNQQNKTSGSFTIDPTPIDIFLVDASDKNDNLLIEFKIDLFARQIAGFSVVIPSSDDDREDN